MSKVITMVLCVLAIFASLGFGSEMTICYTRDCVLVVYDDTDAVFEDFTGNLWGIPKEECDIPVGTDCVLVLDSLGTPSIYDDVIVEVNEK